MPNMYLYLYLYKYALEVNHHFKCWFLLDDYKHYFLNNWWNP